MALDLSGAVERLGGFYVAALGFLGAAEPPQNSGMAVLDLVGADPLQELAGLLEAADSLQGSQVATLDLLHTLENGSNCSVERMKAPTVYLSDGIAAHMFGTLGWARSDRRWADVAQPDPGLQEDDLPEQGFDDRVSVL